MENLFTTIYENRTGQTEPIEFYTQSGLKVTINNPDACIQLLNPTNHNIPKFVLVSGRSESGKSTFGKTGIEQGLANRLKVYKFLGLCYH
jgi:hypothetical protein